MSARLPSPWPRLFRIGRGLVHLVFSLILRILRWRVLLPGSIMILLLSLSFPIYSLSPSSAWCIWIAFVPALWIGEGEDPFFCGVALGMGCCAAALICLFWILKVSPLLFCIVAVAIFLEAFLAGYLYRWVADRSPATRWLFLPCLVPVLEYVRNLGTYAFPGGQMGSALHAQTLLIQIVELTGVYGLSFLIILVNVALFLALSKKTYLPLLFSFLLLGGSLLYGKGALEKEEKMSVAPAAHSTGESATARAARPLTILLVQSQHKVYSPAQLSHLFSLTEEGLKKPPDPHLRRPCLRQPRLRRDLRDLRDLRDFQPAFGGPAFGGPACGGIFDLVIWPEATILEMSREKQDRIIERLRAFIREHRVPLLVGIHQQERDERGVLHTYNKAVLLTPSGEGETVYRKIHLIPYWESLPFPFSRFGKSVQWLLSMIHSRPQNQWLFLSPGTEDTIHRVREGRFNSFLCLEGIYEDLARRSVRAGANLLVNISSDRWTPYRSEIFQASSIPLFRAIEFRRSLVRCGDVGISYAVDPSGRILARTDPLEERALPVQVFLRNSVTFYSRYGNLFVYLCAMVSFLILLAAWRKR